MEICNDRFWVNTADFLRSNDALGTATLAPLEFQQVFDARHAYSDCNRIKFDDLDWVVLHKGRLDEIHTGLLCWSAASLIPVFANEVFVVYARKGARLKNENHLIPFFERVLELAGNATATAKLRGDTVAEKTSFHSSRNTYLGNHRAIIKTQLGHKLIVDTEDLSLTPHLILDGYWESWVTNVFISRLGEGMTIADVGANIGYYSTIAAGKVGPSGMVHCFEANPSMAEILAINMEINGFLNRAVVNDVAVYSVSTELEFSCRQKYRGSSGIWGSRSQIGPLRDGVDKISVKAISLDDYFASNTRLDLIKIDAEAAELEIMKGAERIIHENNEIEIILEFIPSNLDISGSAAELLNLISSFGFEIFRIEDDSSLKPMRKNELLKLPYSELFLARK